MDRAEAIKQLGILQVFGAPKLKEAVDMAIAALREQAVQPSEEDDCERDQSPWISVKDHIPKCMKRYFITYQFEGSDMRFYGEAMFHPEGGNGCVDRPHFSNEGVDGMHVTHWMEIPKLPTSDLTRERTE